MAELSTLARPYAEAAFKRAKQTQFRQGMVGGVAVSVGGDAQDSRIVVDCR